MVKGSSEARGRRPGNPDTRAAILAAAKAEFVANGFDRTSIRGVAKVAGVDPALVHHYFDSKDDLFLASLELPFDPRQLIPELAAGGVDMLGFQIARRFVALWDNEQTRAPLMALLKASTTSEAAAGLLRNGLGRMVLGPISAVIDAPDAEVRANLVVSQIIGMGMARYVLGIEPLASWPSEDVVRRLGPTLQAYIDGPPAGA